MALSVISMTQFLMWSLVVERGYQTKAIICPTQKQCKDIMSNIYELYYALPDYIKPGITSHLKMQATFTNGAIVTGCQPCVLRGLSITDLYVHEDLHEKWTDDLSVFKATGARVVVFK